MTITYIELDTLRRDMLIEAGNRYSMPAVRLQKLIEFTTKLHTLLVSEVVGARFYYRPYTDQHHQFIWGRSVYGGDIAITVGSTSLYWRADGDYYKVISTQEMVTSVREYVEGTRMELEVHSYCKGCWFSDEEVDHCGMGLPLSLDCMDYTPVGGL